MQYLLVGLFVISISVFAIAAGKDAENEKFSRMICDSQGYIVHKSNGKRICLNLTTGSIFDATAEGLSKHLGMK
jgi:hypothetical protein